MSPYQPVGLGVGSQSVRQCEVVGGQNERSMTASEIRWEGRETLSPGFPTRVLREARQNGSDSRHFCVGKRKFTAMSLHHERHGSAQGGNHGTAR